MNSFSRVPIRIIRLFAITGLLLVFGAFGRGGIGVASANTPDVPNCPDDSPIFVVVEEQPGLIGGLEGVQEAVVYPRSALEDRAEGRVFVQGVVDTLGHFVDPQVTRGIRDDLNVEAVRVLSESSFTPGVQAGKKVCVQMSFPVTFRLPFPIVLPHARASRPTVRPGERLTYALTVTNPGVRVENIVSTIQFPRDILSFSPPPGLSCDGLCAAEGNGTWMVGTLAPGQSRTLFYQVQFSDGASTGTALSTISTSASSTEYRQSSITTDIEDIPRERLHLSSDPAPASPGLDQTYRISIGNPDFQSITGVVRVALPDKATFVSATEGGQETDRFVFWPETTIDSGEGAQAQFTISLDDPLQEGSALDIAGEWIPTSSTASTSLTSIVTPIRAERALEAEYFTDRSAAGPGERVQYSLTLTNTDTSALGGVTARILLPEMIEGFDAPPILDCGSDSLCEPSEIITWEVGNLSSSESRSLPIEVTISDQALRGHVSRSLALVMADDHNEITAGADLIIGIDTPLPVELATFTGTASGEAVTLAWQTVSETNNVGFDVERSTDGTVFAKIGHEAGRGTTTEAHTYRFVDADVPFADTLHYRLRQVDLDGTAEYSSVVTVGLAPRRFALLPNAPNPFQGATRLRYTLTEEEPVSLQVYDLLGRRVATLVDREQPAGRYAVTLDGTRLPSGTYFVRLQAGARMQTQRIAVVR